MKNEAMKEREKNAGVVWRKEGKYWIGEGFVFGKVIYIKLPKNHPCYSMDYMSLNVNVNGGLTFGNDGIFGWDYSHFGNSYDYEGDIKRALKYFKSKEKKNENRRQKKKS